MRYMKSILVVPAILSTAMWSGCGSTTTTAAPASSVLANSNTANTNVRKTVTPVAKTPEPTPVAKATIGAEHEAGVAALKKHGITVSTKDMDVDSVDAKHLVVLGKGNQKSAEYKVAHSYFMFKENKGVKGILADAQATLPFNSLTADELKNVLIASGVTSVKDLNDDEVVAAIMTESLAKHGVVYNHTFQRFLNRLAAAESVADRRLATAVIIVRSHAGSAEEKIAALLKMVGSEPLVSEAMKSFAVRVVEAKNDKLTEAFILALVQHKRAKILADVKCTEYPAYVIRDKAARMEAALDGLVDMVDVEKNMKVLNALCGRLQDKKAEYIAFLAKNGVDVEYVAAITPVVIEMVHAEEEHDEKKKVEMKEYVARAKAAINAAKEALLDGHDIDSKRFDDFKIGAVLKAAIVGSGIEQADSEMIVKVVSPLIKKVEKVRVADVVQVEQTPIPQ